LRGEQIIDGTCESMFSLRVCPPRATSGEQGIQFVVPLICPVLSYSNVLVMWLPLLGLFSFVSFLEGDMPQGRIKKLVADKGFGFIDGERGDLFFHHSEVQDITFEELREGQEVEFEIGQGPKGPRANSVRLVEQPA
jgi:cold shock protein